MRAWYFVTGLALICGLGCATLDELFENEKEIPLSEVPGAAVAAAKGAVEGIELTEAEVEKEDGQTVYDIEGTANGKEYSIEVTAEGEVLEVEEGTEQEDDDAEGEDDD
ncbi:MAG: PepSY domain-containing protein [Phycisphaerales bacterium]|nr:MAG: PepSY domain-containing protein [Phycisphaerales bacterium]